LEVHERSVPSAWMAGERQFQMLLEVLS
jgi:hypothetical protein